MREFELQIQTIQGGQARQIALARTPAEAIRWAIAAAGLAIKLGVDVETVRVIDIEIGLLIYANR